MRMDHYFIYPKMKSGKRSEYCICVVLREERIFHGISLCGPEDQYNKKEGRSLAYNRAIESYNRWKIKQELKKIKG